MNQYHIYTTRIPEWKYDDEQEFTIAIAVWSSSISTNIVVT